MRNYFIYFFLLPILGFAQNKATSYIKQYTISDCCDSCSLYNSIVSKEYHQNVLKIKFTYTSGCTSPPDTFAIDVVDDTLKLFTLEKTNFTYYKSKRWITDHLNKKSGPNNSFSACECTYLIEAEIALVKEPKYYVNFIYVYDSREKNFVDVGWYKRNRDKKWENNSNKITAKELLGLFNGKLNPVRLQKIYSKLGNDSLINTSFNFVDYKEDGISFDFTPSGDLMKIEIEKIYLGQIPGNVKWNETSGAIEKRLGVPTKSKNIIDYSVDSKTGETIENIKGYNAFYKKEKLLLKYDESGKIEQIIITSIFD